MVGSEYLLHTRQWLKEEYRLSLLHSVPLSVFSKGKKTTPLPDGVPDDITEEEMRFFYRNRKGKLIFKPVYEIYRDNFVLALVKNTRMIAEFGGFKNTGIYERYMLNAAQFSGAKSAAEGRMLQSAVFKDDGAVKSFSQFRKDALQITTIQNDVWRRVEYDTARKGAISLDQFQAFIDNADLQPYWIYHGVMDDRERPEHVELEAKIFRIGDADGDAVFPPNGFNCRCTGDSLGDTDVKGRPISQGKDMLQHVDPQFRFNPATQGILPKTGHSYFEILPSANSAGAKMFRSPDTNSAAIRNRTVLAGQGMHYALNIIQDWRNEYHTESTGNIVFQNARLYSNIVFTNNILHAIRNHTTGLSKLPDTVQSPDEVWSMWADPDTQQQVLRAYIKGDYVVMTLNGNIIDAVQTGYTDKYRKGLPV